MTMQAALLLSLLLVGGAWAKDPRYDPKVMEQVTNEALADDEELIPEVQKKLKGILGEWPAKPETKDPKELQKYREKMRELLAPPEGGSEADQKAWEILSKVIRRSIPPEDIETAPSTPEKKDEQKKEGETRDEAKKEEIAVGGTRIPNPVPITEPSPAYFPRVESSRNEAQNHPEDSEAQADYGSVNFHLKNYVAAYRYLDRALGLGEDRPDIWILHGQSAFQLGDYEAAARSFAEAARQGDSRAESLYKLVAGRSSKVRLPSSRGGQGRPLAAPAEEPAQGGTPGAAPYAGQGQGAGMTAAEIAAAAARQAAAPPSKIQQSSAVTRQAASALGVRDYSAAHALSSQAIDLNPRNAQAWNYRAIAGSKLGRYADAVYDSSFALGLAPDNAAALQTRSWAFSKQRKYKEGLADASLTLEKDPGNSFAYQNRAFALAGLGDRQGVLDSLRRSAQINPQFQPKYEEALQVPEGSDLLFLFDEESGAKAALVAEAAAPAPRPGARNKRFLRLVLLSLSGGLLVALGILHIVSSSWREKVRHTMRRVLGGARGSPVAEGQEFPSGFWAQYQPIREIGTGGMGVVYEALDRSLDRRVAIKKMRDEIRLDPAERQRFITEARTVASLHHPNIVDIYSIVEDGQDVYLVFEYVPGRTLFELMREKGPMDFDQARAILRGACEAVEHAHRQKIVHRDIKPSNIMISEEGVVKVMDFGVARQAKEAITKMAMTNTIVGTPPYMAPEQEQGTVRKESDVFALGVCLYELLCGQLPFTGQGAGMLLNKINARHVPLSQQVKHGLPKGLDEVLAKVLTPDPEKRYRTPSEFLAALVAVAAARLG